MILRFLYHPCYTFLLFTDKCCPLKVVGGIEYKHVGEINDPDSYGCSNGCVYESVYGNTNAQFCFKPGSKSSECVTFPFTTPVYHGNHLHLLSSTKNRHAFWNEEKQKPNRTVSSIMN